MSSNLVKKSLKTVKRRLSGKKSQDGGNKPLVGLLRPNKVSPVACKAIAAMAPGRKVEIVYFNPRNVDVEHGVIRGRVLKGDTWVKTISRIPDIIDVSPYCFKARNKEVIDFLKERSFFTDDRSNRITKRELPRLLAADPEFAQYAIETAKVSTVDRLKNFIRRHGECVVKPVYSQRGADVFRIGYDVATQSYAVGFKTGTKNMSEDEFADFAKEHFLGRAHIVQQYVSSRSAAGDPFDCRVHVEKDKNNRWQVARMFVRIGIGQQVISNVNQGGGIADVEPFFKANRPDCWEEIIAKLNHLAQTLPYYFEDLRGRHLIQMGIDVGVDAQGGLHVFEINSSPAADSHKAEVAMLRLGHYHWMYKHIVKGKEPFVPQRPWEESSD